MPTRHQVLVEQVYYDSLNKTVVVNGKLMGRPVQLPIWSIADFKPRPPEEEMERLARIARDKLVGKSVTLECPDV